MAWPIDLARRAANEYAIARRALMGVSAYAMPPQIDDISLGSSAVEAMRRMFGGQLALPAYTQSRWYLSDLESAEHTADSGDMAMAARLMRSARRDGVYGGVLSTRTAGLVRLPIKFSGHPKVLAALDQEHNARSVFDDMFPPSELALLAADGLELGVGVAELCPVEGRAFPVMIRLDPEFLYYRWAENRWYYRSVVGMLPIEPGDGRWILHQPGGRMSPWQHGIWRSIGQSYIRKTHAALHKDNYEAKLANPARVAVAPQGAAEQQKQSWFQQVMAWGINTVFAAPVGYDVRLLESNGRGWEAFDTTIVRAEQDLIIAVAGQVVTTTGGTGFANTDIHRAIRADLIKDTADGLAYTINTQGIPTFISSRFGEAAITEYAATIEWDVRPPKDMNAEAAALVTVANALMLLKQALELYGETPNAGVLCDRFSIPVLGDTDNDGVSETAAKSLADGSGHGSIDRGVPSLAPREAGPVPDESEAAA